MTTLPDTLDDALEVGSGFQVDKAYLVENDAKIRALGAEIVTQRGLSYAWARPMADPDGDAIPMGCAVAVRPANTTDPVVIAATAADIAAGAVLAGVAVEAMAPGSRGRVAVAGVVPPSVTGLGGYGSNRYARANASTGQAEATTSLSGGDTALGVLTADGAIVLALAYSTMPAAAPSLSAQSATVTGPGVLSLTVEQSEADHLDLTGTPGADVGVALDPSASRPVGTLFVIWNGTDSAQTITDPASSDFAMLAAGAFAIVLWTAGGALFAVARSDALTAVPPQGFATIAMADANQTPSFSTAANFVLRLTGALTANRNLVLPLTSGRSWYVINDCTGAYGVVVKGATGSTVTVGNGSKITVVTDGTNFYL